MLILMLLAVMLPVAWASAQQKVTIAQTANGTIRADKSMANENEMVTLTIGPADGYQLRDGSLLVEKVVEADSGDRAIHTRGTTLSIGDYVTTSKIADATYTFVMPATDVEVRASFRKVGSVDVEIPAVETADTTQTVPGVTMEVGPTSDGQTFTVETVNMPADAQNEDITVIIPATVTGSNGRLYAISTVAADAFLGLTNVSDIVLPETEGPIVIEENAFRLDGKAGSDHRVARIHTPLALLDDYALMTALSENYARGKVQATAKAVHRYWTFSCGVDVRLPEGVKFYSCRQLDGESVEIVPLSGDIIAANNGVLMACADDHGNAYEMVAILSDAHPSGSVPSTGNARTYAGNQLEPVIQGTHYEAGSYYVMASNAFHAILQENAEVRIPACKAVLHLPEGSRARVIPIK